MHFWLISEVIHPRVKNCEIKHQKKHGIFVLSYATNTKQDQNTSFFVKTELQNI